MQSLAVALKGILQDSERLDFAIAPGRMMIRRMPISSSLLMFSSCRWPPTLCWQSPGVTPGDIAHWDQSSSVLAQ
jgi:hypothetical protein